MGFKIVAGRAKTGKSTYIYDEINKEISNGSKNNLLLVVPEQMTYQSEYEVIDRISSSGIMSLEVLSFKRLGYKVFEEVGGLKVQEINRYGKIMLLKKIFEENKDKLKLFKKASRQEGFLREFDSLISELKQSMVSEEFLEQILKHKVTGNDNHLLNSKLEDILTIYSEINKHTKDRFFDEEDKMDLFISAVAKSKFVRNSKIWIDGFESFNGQRLKLIKELVKYAVSVTVTLNIDPACINSLQNIDDWEAFKTVHETFKSLTDEDVSFEIAALNEHAFAEEIKIVEKSMFSLKDEKFSILTDKVQLRSSLNPYTETEKTALEIICLVRDQGYRWKDIGVAVGDMDTYSINVKKVFTQFEIPFFLDMKRDIMGNPLTKFILSLFDMFIYNFKHDSVFEFLKTGFSVLNYDEVSKLENFALQYGIEGEKWFRAFRFKCDGIEYFNSLREKFTSGMKEAKTQFKKLDNAMDITLFLFDFLDKFNVQEKIERQVNVFKKSNLYELSSENAQVWNYVVEILEQIILTGGNMEINPSDYRKMIEAGFREVKISIIPPTLDKVTVGETDKISVKSYKALFILGANEGKLDSRSSESGLLLNDEREILAASGMKAINNADYYMYREKHMLYKLFSSAGERLYLSYAMGTSEGKSLQPSMYTERLKSLFTGIKEKSDLSDTWELDNVSSVGGTVDTLVSKLRDFSESGEITDVWKNVYAWYEENDENTINIIKLGLLYENRAENINKENLEKIYQMPVTMSVSRLESFAACPFKFFMENIIKPQPRIVQKVEFYDIGNIYHQAVERFTNEIISSNIDIDTMDEEMARKISCVCTENILAEGEMDYIALDANERNKYMKEKIKRLVNRAADTIIKQLQRGSFRPKFTELSIGDKDGNIFVEPVEIKIDNDLSIYFQGRIDRVDTFEKEQKTYVNIIDYKSSYKDIDLSDAVQGLQLQLLVYMSAIMKNGEKLFASKPEIGGAYYFLIDDPLVDGDVVLESTPQDLIFNKLSLKGYVLEDSEIITGMDNEIGDKKASDIIPVTFNKDGSTSKSSKTLTDKEFKALLSKTDSVAKDIAGKILAGNIGINPYRKESGDKVPCSFCDFRGVCQFDPSSDKNSYRKIKKLKKDEIMLEIMKEGEPDEI
ncbi:MAG: PD-(D/E)XK nuclease family protein [Sedimentibacter saalensis]|uniref:PD-(D/E)XK nuclease family protein n=1 Tax=Sedimentibacter saalensis TaxID=130788 RepID=UPI002B1FCFA7|nr:PD-(D/E)XK nuclease family protein [Sedimentibacter saalensis]MEA5093981.1 PD-(D/E)XK nuclease family protein [Sedimentibacter saalensis]